MERFSPLFTQRALFPANYLRPEASYGLVYPEGVDLTRVAYFFEYSLVGSLDDTVYAPTRERVQCWQEAWKKETRPTLTLLVVTGVSPD